jgi:hypothetical protein
MAEAGGGKLKPFPGTGNPREKAAAYDEETKFKNLQKDVANRLDLSLSERNPTDILAKLDTLKAEHVELQLLKSQLASLPALQEASDILDTVIKNLSATLKPKAEIPTIVSQLVAGNGQLRNNAVSNEMTLESRTQIGMFRPIRMDHTNCLQVAIKSIQFNDAEIARLHKALQDANAVSIEHTQLKKDVGRLTAQVALLPALSAASKTLDAVIERLGGKSAVKDQDIPTLVEQLMFSYVGLQQKAGEDAFKLQEAIVQQGVAASNAGRSDETISTLRAEIAELGKKAVEESSTDEIRRLNEEIVAQRLTVERHQNESIALQGRITSLDKELANEKNHKEAFADQAVELTEQIKVKNGEMLGFLQLLAAQEKLVTDERTKTQKLTDYIMELGGMISEVPDILSASWLMKPLPKTVWMSERPALFQFDGLDTANLKLMQGRLQKFDEAMLALYRRLKKSLEEHEELKLDIQAQTSAIKVKNEMIDNYDAYKSVLALGIIDMADHLNWIMAGLKAESAIRRPVLVAGERWHAGKKQILDLVIQFEGNLVKVSTQRTLNIAYAAEIKKLKEQPTFTPLTSGDVVKPILHEDNERLTTELKTARSENAACQSRISVLEIEIAGLKRDALTAEGARITSHTEDDAYPDTSWPRTSDTVDSEKLHGLLLRLQYLVGPDFGHHKYFEKRRTKFRTSHFCIIWSAT